MAKKIDWKKAEKVKLLKNVRVKEHGAEFAKAHKVGDVVTVSGEIKYDLIMHEAAELVSEKK